MPVRLVRPGDSSTNTTLVCSFVNNMPDGAFEATERQFLDLLDLGSGNDVVDVRLHTMEGVPRGERAAARISSEYSPLSSIESNRPDILVVTGSNPLEPRLSDEPYWSEMVELLTWGRDHVKSMLLSCLSAHAALSIYDDLPRVRLASKCTGVFTQHVDRSHPLCREIDGEILLPHSRTSDVSIDLLERAGYRIAVRSDEIGWSVATKKVGACDLVLVQGHPEYDPSSLIREYHRDAGRYVRRERNDEPILPRDCVARDDWDELSTLHRDVITRSADSSRVEGFPFEPMGQRAPWPWRPMASQFYANWLSSVAFEGDCNDAR